jgi:hypothetical protein
MAQMRAAFLGDEHVSASDVVDDGSRAIGAGGVSGDDVGDAYGVGGIGMSGVGEGGGGSGDGTIGLDDIGTIGRGDGSGFGYGYARGMGGLRGRRPSVPDVVWGSADVRGACDGDMIRRVMRAHINELRFCYERVLQSRPSLTGRTVTRFALERGRVTAAAAAGFVEVDACVAGAIERWQFPTCTAIVSWPVVFVPTDSAP